MIITFKDLLKVKFPLFVLPGENWYIADGVLFLDGLVVDEKNMPGASLGTRRLQCDRSDLLPLKRAVEDIPSLLRCKSHTFIDQLGKPFIYQKTRSSKLDTYRVKSVQRKDTASLLWVHGVPHPFTIKRPPLNDPEWVRLLHLDSDPWIVYDYVRFPPKPTYRRI